MAPPGDFTGRATEALWRALVDNVPYYVALISPDQRLVYLNRPFGSRPISAFTGRFMAELLPAGSEAGLTALGWILEHGGTERLELPLSGDSTRWFELHLTAIREPDGGVVGVLAVGIETTERRQTAIELRMSVNALHRLIEAREQISADLHDGILQSLYGVGLRLEAARTAGTGDPGAILTHLDRAIGQLNDTMKDIRRFIKDDRAPVLMTSEWEDTFAGVLRGLESLGGPRLAIDIDRDAAGRVPARLRSDVVFIAREAVSNAMRHSGAGRVSVTLTQDASRVRLAIEDDGRGFSNQPNGEGFGLLTMTRRAGQIGAVLNVQSNPGGGTAVRIDLPVS